MLVILFINILTFEKIEDIDKKLDGDSSWTAGHSLCRASYK